MDRRTVFKNKIFRELRSGLDPEVWLLVYVRATLASLCLDAQRTVDLEGLSFRSCGNEVVV